MKYLLTKDNAKRVSFFKKELLLTVLKLLRKNKKIKKTVRWKMSFFFFSINTKFFKTKIINRCVISGRQSGILSKFKLSRIVFAKYSYSGKLFGIKSYS